MNKKKLILISLAVIFICSFVYFNFSYIFIELNKTNVEKQNFAKDTSKIKENDSATDKGLANGSSDVEIFQLDSLSEPKPEERDCSSLVLAYLNSAKGRAVVRWQESLGMPSMDWQNNHSFPFIEHPYKYYKNADLLEMAKNGDRFAMYAYGQNMLWKAFTDEELSPALSEGWAYPEITSFIDESALKEARYWLYRAVLYGSIYTSHNLARVASFERKYLEQNQTLTPERDKELRLQAYIYGELPEKLIKGLHKNTYQGEPSPEWQQEFDSALLQLVDNYQKERVKLGLSRFEMEVPKEYLELQNLCN
ncbi:hypothetical protein [Kangiella sp.]|uniref:hypothetical protein n=1 Tax=Kangiella sp. TaxID=1920245 RepID=UPI0019ACE7E5|nr:hypothetical protein [Kangiella sp.]MBD3654764.1 hypothetical protein [Kangiella sp.]